MPDIHNILIVGVGGQGILLASELLGAVAFEAGYDVKKSEVHGMAQRGGVVSSHVRFGEKVYSPLIPEGEADTILAFEEAEAQRWLHFLKPGGNLIVNRRRLVPPIALMRDFSYPSDPVERVRERSGRVIPVDAMKFAKEIGNPKVENILLLGTLSTTLWIDAAIWTDTIRKWVPKETVEINLKAFDEGRNTVSWHQ
ncbi:MAG TPA: indolepyruvate oxidoreductase subunit beta [bacterium]|nr:indolepyruvate oxidoreductase subunit beta [bacterium]